MKSTLLLALALAAVEAAPAASKADAQFSWASVLEGRPIVGNEDVKQDVHEFLGLSPDVKFRNFKALDTVDGLERRASPELTTNNMCGAFQEKANGTAAGYSTAAAMFKVPKLARRGTSSDTQIISTFVGIDGIRCPGMEIGVISTISSTGSQRNLAYFRYGDDAPYRVGSVNPNNGDLMAAATTFDADGTVYVMIMNRETGDKYGDYLTLGPKPCMSSVSWTVEDYVVAEGATPLPKEHYPSWEPVKFGYMDANKTDGSSFHLDGATFTSMVGAANGTLAGKLICRGAPNANITNQMLISAL